MDGTLVARLSWELYRQRAGLEARAVVALAMMSPSALDKARAELTLRDLLSPAYVALAAALLDPETPPAVSQRIRAQLAGRSYLPTDSGSITWDAEGRWCVAELAARRARWDARVAAEQHAKGERAAKRAKRIAAPKRAKDPTRLTPREMHEAFKHFFEGGDLSPQLRAKLQ